MSASWRFIRATFDPIENHYTIDFCVGVDQYASTTVTPAAYPNGPWREVIQLAADGMINPEGVRYAPRRRHR